MFNKRSVYSFSLDRPGKINLYYNLMRRDNVSMIIRTNDLWLIEDAIKNLSEQVYDERLFAVVGTDNIDGQEYETIFLTYNKGEVNTFHGNLFVITNYKLIYLGDIDELNDNLDLHDLRDVEALLGCASKALKLTFGTAKRIIKSMCDNRYHDIPEFFNVLSEKVLPDLLPSSEISKFLKSVVKLSSFGKEEVLILDETYCYPQEKGNHLNHILAIK